MVFRVVHIGSAASLKFTSSHLKLIKLTTHLRLILLFGDSSGLETKDGFPEPPYFALSSFFVILRRSLPFAISFLDLSGLNSSHIVFDASHLLFVWWRSSVIARKAPLGVCVLSSSGVNDKMKVLCSSVGLKTPFVPYKYLLSFGTIIEMPELFRLGLWMPRSGDFMYFFIISSTISNSWPTGFDR